MKALPLGVMMVLAATLFVSRSTSAGDPPTADEKLTANSLWKGTFTQDPRKAKGESKPASIRIKTHDDEKIEAIFKIGTRRKAQAMRIAGTVDHSGHLKLRPVAIESGEWQNHAMDKVYLGVVKGEKLTLRIVDADSADPNSQGPTVELTLSSSDED